MASFRLVFFSQYLFALHLIICTFYYQPGRKARRSIQVLMSKVSASADQLLNSLFLLCFSSVSVICSSSVAFYYYFFSFSLLYLLFFLFIPSDFRLSFFPFSLSLFLSLISYLTLFFSFAFIFFLSPTFPPRSFLSFLLFPYPLVKLFFSHHFVLCVSSLFPLSVFFSFSHNVNSFFLYFFISVRLEGHF